jgi:hypothetical protein
MKRISFKTSRKEGNELVMSLRDIRPEEIRFNIVTREITIIEDDKFLYHLEDIDQMSWQKLKKMVLEHGGEWTTKQAGLDFLTKVKA